MVQRQHLATYLKNLPIGNERITDPENVATKLNLYFASVSDILNENNSTGSSFDSIKISQFVDSKVPQHIQFTLPFITTEQVKLYINNLEHSKATGLDGLGPRIIKLAVDSLSPSIAMLVNKSIATGEFPSQLKIAKVLPIFKGGDKSDPSNYRPISILPTVSKIF